MTSRERLIEERRRASRRLAALTHDFTVIAESVRLDPPDDEHDPEGATRGFERAQVAALAEAVRGRIAELDAALARLDAGTFGSCAGCGEAIDPERLAARPGTRWCITCAR